MYTGVFTGSCINVYNLHIIKKILMDKGKYKQQVCNWNQTVFLTDAHILLWLQFACVQLTTIERHFYITPSYN